jgi:hypothetical protein
MSLDPMDELDRLLRRLHAVLLGGEDMRHVITAAGVLRALDDPEDEVQTHIRTALETGMIVIYARPFTKSEGLATLKLAKGLSPALRARHRDIMGRRDTVYAHTDESDHRQVLEFSDADALVAWLRQPGEFSYHWEFPAPEILDDVVALAEANLVSFGTEHEKLRVRIVALFEELTRQESHHADTALTSRCSPARLVPIELESGAKNPR